MKKHVLRQNVEPMEPLFDLHETGSRTDYASEPVGGGGGAGAMEGTRFVEKGEVTKM